MNLLPATDDLTTTRTRRQGCLRAVGITTLVLPAAADVLIAVADGKTLWPVLLLLSLGLAAVLRPSAHRPAGLTTQLRAAVPAGVSLALTAVATTAGAVRTLGPGEAAVLCCLPAPASWTGPPWTAHCLLTAEESDPIRPARLPDQRSDARSPARH
ncbi:hypothetical protein [Streptomyces massasporeus]|uniref:hypothetical protein n=1 Tax=Streptomyces massasporeus TaxID=67324 RepID=UPI0033C5E8D0